jgi:hypothetical protein
LNQVKPGPYVARLDPGHASLCPIVLPIDADGLAGEDQSQGWRGLCATNATPAYAGSGYVAADELGAAVNPEWLSDEFHRLADSAGLPRIRMHDTRHSVNSLMAAAGVPDHIRAAWFGQSPAVNVGTYTHARTEDMPVAAAALGKIMNAA